MEDNKMKISVFGNGAREAIIAEKLSSQFSIYAVMSVPNPSIIDIVDNTHGKYIVEPNYNIDRIIKFHQDNNIIMSCIQQDNLLADGMVDILQKNNIKVFGATKAASQLEWDKNFALNIIRYICPEALPKSLTLRNFDENRFNDFLNNSI